MAIYKALDKMKFDYTNIPASVPYQRINATEIYLAKPGKRIIGNLNGIDEESCHLEINFQNTSVLEFTVNRIIDGEISNHYDLISQHYELYVKGFGWFKINEEPQVDNDGTSETKSVRAESLEIELQQYDLVLFDINTGENWSKEMMAPDNTYTYVDDYKLQYDNVKFYRDLTDWDNLIAQFPDDGTEADLMNYVRDGQHNFLLDSWRFKLDLDEFENGVNKAAEEYTKGGLKDAAKSIITRWEMSKTQGNAFNMLIAYPQIKQYVNYIGVDTTYTDENGDEQTVTIKEILIRERNRFHALSFLDLVLEGTGWKPGYIDPNYNAQSEDPAEKEKLADRVGYFQVDSQDVYSFLTQEAAPYYRCIFDFDTETCTVNAYKMETVGKDTNIFLSFHNIQNSVTKSSDRQFHTVYHVANGTGDDSIDIRQANFGWDSIEDLSFFMNRKHFPQSFIDHYNEWLEYKEGHRQEYMDLAVEWRDANDVMSEIYNRVPVDSAKGTQYSSFTVTELEAERANCLAQLRGYQAMHVDDENKFDLNDLMNSRDWGPYHTIDTVVLSTPHDTINVDDDSQPKTENALWVMNNDATVGKLINDLYDLKTQIDKENEELEQLLFEIDVLEHDTIPFLQQKFNEAKAASDADPDNQDKKAAMTTAQNDLKSAQDRLASKRTQVSPKQNSISSKESEIRSKEPTIETHYKNNKYEGIIDEDTIKTVLMYCLYDNKLGTIDTELFNRWLVNIKSIGDTIIKREFDDDYLYDFAVYGPAYGLKELETQLKSLEDKVQTEKQYASKSGQSDEYHKKHKDLYEKYLDAYNECKTVYDTRKAEYEAAEAEVKRISDEMTALAKSVQLENFVDSKGVKFTEKELELLKKYYIHTDYVNDNIVITEMFTNKQIVDAEYDLIKDAYEELYADSHPQWSFQTTQDNLLLMPELQDWHGELEVGNFIRVGFRDDDPYYIFSSNEDNQVKLRLITIGFNPFMIEPTIDLTFSNMIQYKSKRNDFVEIIGSASGSSGKNQITATYNSQSNATTNVTTDFIMQLLNSTTFNNGMANNIAAGIVGGGVITDALNSMDLSVDQISDLTTRLSDLADGYLDANLIVTKILNAEEANIQRLITKTVNAQSVIAGLVDADYGDFDNLHADSAFIEKFKSDYINTAYIESEVADLDVVHSQIITADSAFVKSLEALSTNVINSTVNSEFVVNLVANHLTANQLAAGDLVLTDGMRIVSNNENGGNVLFNGSTLQFLDSEGNVGIQIGYNTEQDATHPHIVITDDNGSTILTSSGITTNAVADQLLVNRMFKDSTIEKTKINFPIFQPNDYGGTDIYIPHDPESGQAGHEYVSFINDYLGVSPYVELDQHNIVVTDPNNIVLTATTHFGAVIDRWEIDALGYHNSVETTSTTYTVDPEIINDYMYVRVRVVCKNGLSADISDTAFITLNTSDNSVRQYTEYCLYDSSTTIDTSQVTWSKERPDPDRSNIDSIEDINNNFIWQRDVIEEYEEVSSNDNEQTTERIIYRIEFDPVCFVEITTMQFIMDKAKRSILSRLADQTTATINDSITRLTTRESVMEQTLDGVKSAVSRSDVDYITLPDGTQIQTVAKSVNTVAEQTADTFSWIIQRERDDEVMSKTNFVLTPDMASLVSNQLVITDPDNDTSTVISGGKINANSITTNMLTSDIIKSYDFLKRSSLQENQQFSLIGSFLDLENGNFITPFFGVINEAPEGSGLTVGAYFDGNIHSITGEIGGWNIVKNAIYSNQDNNYISLRNPFIPVVRKDFSGYIASTSGCATRITNQGLVVTITDNTNPSLRLVFNSTNIDGFSDTSGLKFKISGVKDLNAASDYNYYKDGTNVHVSVNPLNEDNENTAICGSPNRITFVEYDSVETGISIFFKTHYHTPLLNDEYILNVVVYDAHGEEMLNFKNDVYIEDELTIGTNHVLTVTTQVDDEATTPFYLTSDGYLYAQNANIKGSIIADTGYIGGTNGWVIEESKIKSNVAANQPGFAMLSTSDFTHAINGVQRTGLRFAIGQKFGVANDGTVYASGSINASELNIYNGSNTYNLLNYIKVDSDGLKIIHDNNVVATYGSNTILGSATNNITLTDNFINLKTDGIEVGYIARGYFSKAPSQYGVTLNLNYGAEDGKIPAYVGLVARTADDTNEMRWVYVQPNASIPDYTSGALNAGANVDMNNFDISDVGSIYATNIYATNIYPGQNTQKYIGYNENGSIICTGPLMANTSVHQENVAFYAGGNMACSGYLFVGNVNHASSGHYKLDVNGNSYISGILEVSESISLHGDIIINRGNGRLSLNNNDITITSFTASMKLHAIASANDDPSLTPGANGTYLLGVNSAKWKAVYATNGTINTSDEKEKDIYGGIEYANDLIMQLEPIEYMWKSGHHRRYRMGFSAQKTAKLCQDLGKNLALVTASYKPENNEIENKKEYFGEDVDDELLSWGMSRDELIAPMVKVLQLQDKRITQLENEIQDLKEKLNYEITKH